MKFEKVNNHNIGIVQYNDKKIISNQNDILQVLSQSVDMQYDWYKQYYDLLVPQSYAEINSVDQLDDINDTSFIFSKSIQFNLNEDKVDYVYTYSAVVPTQVIKNTTIFDFINGNGYSINDTHNSDYLSNGYFRINDINDSGSVFDWLIKNFKAKYDVAQNDKYNSIFLVRKPPAYMRRYIKKDIDNIDVVVPPIDMFQVTVNTGSTINTIETTITKKISKVNSVNHNIFSADNLPEFQHNETDWNGLWYYSVYNSTQWTFPNDTCSALIYPSIKRLQLELFNDKPLKIKKIVNLTDTFVDYSNYFNETQLNNFFNRLASGYGPHGDVSDERDWFNQSQCIQINYTDIKLKKLQNIDFTLQDKLGYYNSLIWNYDMQEDYNVIPNGISYDVPNENIFFSDRWEGYSASYVKRSPLYQFKEYHNSNILAINYYQNVTDDNYGFAWPMGKYKIVVDVKIENSADEYDSHQRVKIRLLPINGGVVFSNIINNSDINVCKRNQLYKIFEYGYSHNKQMSPTQLTNLAKFEQSTPTSISVNTWESYLKPIQNIPDYNFMFDRYGQFLTYRIDDEKAFSYNGKTYINTFSQVTNIVKTNIEDGYVHYQIQMDKYFQGNALLSFMVFQKENKLISETLDQTINFNLKNIGIEKMAESIEFPQIEIPQIPDEDEQTQEIVVLPQNKSWINVNLINNLGHFIIGHTYENVYITITNTSVYPLTIKSITMTDTNLQLENDYSNIVINPLESINVGVIPTPTNNGIYDVTMVIKQSSLVNVDQYFYTSVGLNMRITEPAEDDGHANLIWDPVTKRWILPDDNQSRWILPDGNSSEIN